MIFYDSLAGGSGHLAQLSNSKNPEIHREWVERALALLSIEGEIPQSVRHREAIRRLLTATCDDSRLVPEQALTFLRAVMNATQPGTTVGEDEIPCHAPPWRHYRNHEVPEVPFTVWIADGEITGVAAGELQLTPTPHAVPRVFPEPNQIALVRTTDGEVVLGKWFYTEQRNAERPHRLRIRRLVGSYSQDLTGVDFDAVRILAVQTF